MNLIKISGETCVDDCPGDGHDIYICMENVTMIRAGENKCREQYEILVYWHGNDKAIKFNFDSEEKFRGVIKMFEKFVVRQVELNPYDIEIEVDQ